MSIESDLEKVKSILLSMKNYNAKAFTNDLFYLVKDLDYFYSKLVEGQSEKNPSKTYYNIKPTSLRPKVGQIAYVNLRRGYPKELFDGHYCYIYKDFGVKYIVIPTTSVKHDSSKLNPDFEVDVEIKDFINDYPTRLQVSDMRSVDVQRINPQKGVFEVITDQNEIRNNINKIINGDNA